MTTGITFRFEGICTHITYPYPPEDWPHRVVLPRAYDTFVEHEARLIIPQDAAPDEKAVIEFAAGPQMQYEGLVDKNYWVRLTGVSLQISNPAAQAYQQEQSFLCGIPRLSVIAGQWLGQPDPLVVSGEQVSEVWAYFNVSVGTWTAGTRYEGAVVAVLDCLTDGEPLLLATAFGLGQQTSLTLRSGSTLTLQYGASAGLDQEDDFGIQYRVVNLEWRPKDGTTLFPTAPSPCLASLPLPDLDPPAPAMSIGAGCSNSLFP